ncbi:2-hydroxy-3-keto-5-methylthiopentenyl-1-phosphate phosphatase [Paenibacillus senegalensis]|uniref:2-hydroxy-3-keto-5-methylthiopentenyl-1- phosphate phosphatase n=1 Tax=Paenibacillus senegalensis TaxID=1465766 RepID=UPI0002883F61|nr:2-hydroxy-3-keto-5-methylthiopentenyl-1-phosphate phosphatase [Paenibacillus senegalensis]
MKLDPNKQTVIFCDFDGTITLTDNIIAIMKQFQPEGWETILQKTLDKELTLQEGVGGMFALLPASQQKDIVQFTQDYIRIRDGFQELLDYCKQRSYPFLVTSGGMDFFIYPALRPFHIPTENIYCNTGDFTGDHIRIDWPHPCDENCAKGGCGMCKTTIIRSYPASQYNRILIGDSLSDFAGAQVADYVFARSDLAEECKKLQLPHSEYETFFDVINGLESLREESQSICSNKSN